MAAGWAAFARSYVLRTYIIARAAMRAAMPARRAAAAAAAPFGGRRRRPAAAGDADACRLAYCPVHARATGADALGVNATAAAP